MIKIFYYRPVVIGVRPSACLSGRLRAPVKHLSRGHSI